MIKINKVLDFNELFHHEGTPSISIFIGNNSTWPQNRDAMGTLKSKLEKAKTQLAEIEADSSEILQRIDELTPWAEDGNLWKEVKGSIALFISSSRTYLYEVDIPLKNSVHVGSFFDIRALLNLNNFKPFYIFKTSQKENELVYVDLEKHKKIKLEEMPYNFEHFNKYDDPQETLQGQTFKIPHGHGVAKDHKKDRLERYAMVIAHILSKNLHSSDKSRLILMGPTAFVSMIKKELDLHPNTELHIVNKEFHAPLSSIIKEMRAWMLELAQKDEQEYVIEHLQNYKELPLAECKVENIVKNAYEGKIEELYVKKMDYVWGQYSVDDMQVKAFNFHKKGTQDLLNVALIQTLKHGGKVHLFDENALNVSDHAVAILRYN